MAHHSPGAATGLVTGEAVVLDLRLAKLPSRTAAFLIDGLLQLAALLALTFLVGALNASLDETLTLVLFFVSGIAILVGYPVGMETLTRGRTVGKLALGLRVTRDDGGAIRFRHALARGLSAVVEIYLTSGAIAVLVSLVSPEGKRVGDYLAGTVVVRERAPRRAEFTPWLDPQLAPWAATLDLGGLDEPTALAMRQFLVRAGDLGDAARHNLGTSLAGEVQRRVHPPPPPGLSTEGYLHAVLAERRRRADLAATAAAPAVSPTTIDAATIDDAAIDAAASDAAPAEAAPPVPAPAHAPPAEGGFTAPS